MRGLGHYYGARYNQAIAELMLAAEDRGLADISRFWLAKAYLARRLYSHGCLELAKLTSGAPTGIRARDVAASVRECEQHLSPEDMRMIRDMAAESSWSSKVIRE
jgi:hypothetical protein